MTNHYGFPPDLDECAEASPPPDLVTVVSQRVLTPVAGTGMAPAALNRKVPVSAVARQLYTIFDWGRGCPVCVEVDGYGMFRIGPDGWALDKEVST